MKLLLKYKDQIVSLGLLPLIATLIALHFLPSVAVLGGGLLLSLIVLFYYIIRLKELNFFLLLGTIGIGTCYIVRQFTDYELLPKGGITPTLEFILLIFAFIHITAPEIYKSFQRWLKLKGCFSYLLEAIKVCLHANREWRAALVGVGNLGRALLNHREFRRRGFTIVAAFDCDPFKIGETAYGLEVYCTKTLMERVPELNIEIGIITTPPERAQRAASQLVEAGIKGILNYSAARISVPDTVFVEYVDFFHQIYSLTFNISNRR